LGAGAPLKQALDVFGQEVASCTVDADFAAVEVALDALGARPLLGSKSIQRSISATYRSRWH